MRGYSDEHQQRRNFNITMAFIQMVVFSMIVTLASAHIINLEKLVLSVSDEVKETDPVVSEILTSMVTDRSNTSNGLEFDLRKCSKGSCEFCTKKVIKVCVKATVGSSSIHIEVTVAGHAIFHTDITAPREVCMDVKSIPQVRKICLQFTDIDLGKMSGCVSVSVTTKLVPIPVHFKIGCFTIPHVEEEKPGTNADEKQQVTQNEASDTLQPETVLKFLSLIKEK